MLQKVSVQWFQQIFYKIRYFLPIRAQPWAHDYDFVDIFVRILIWFPPLSIDQDKASKSACERRTQKMYELCLHKDVHYSRCLHVIPASTIVPSSFHTYRNFLALRSDSARKKLQKNGNETFLYFFYDLLKVTNVYLIRQPENLCTFGREEWKHLLRYYSFKGVLFLLVLGWCSSVEFNIDLSWERKFFQFIFKLHLNRMTIGTRCEKT